MKLTKKQLNRFTRDLADNLSLANLVELEGVELANEVSFIAAVQEAYTRAVDSEGSVSKRATSGKEA